MKRKIKIGKRWFGSIGYTGRDFDRDLELAIGFNQDSMPSLMKTSDAWRKNARDVYLLCEALMDKIAYVSRDLTRNRKRTDKFFQNMWREWGFEDPRFQKEKETVQSWGTGVDRFRDFLKTKTEYDQKEREYVTREPITDLEIRDYGNEIQTLDRTAKLFYTDWHKPTVRRTFRTEADFRAEWWTIVSEYTENRKEQKKEIGI